MPRHIFIVFLILCFSMSGSKTASAEDGSPWGSSEASHIYSLFLPLSINPKVIEAVVTAQGEIRYHPNIYYLDGYLQNLTTEPLYNVTISLEVTIMDYSGFDLEPDTKIVYFTPVFTATLPGQPNPFSYTLLLFQASASIGPIIGIASNPWENGDEYAPMVLSGLAYTGTVVTGTVCNDNDRPLHHLRVVGFEPDRCSWDQAVLGTDDLRTGEETSFTLTVPNSFCLEAENLVIVGQGAYQP